MYLQSSGGQASPTRKKFEDLKIVREITGQKRGRVYRFDRYIDTLDDGWSERKAAIERNRKAAAADSRS